MTELIEKIIRDGKDILANNPQFGNIWMQPIQDIEPDVVSELCKEYGVEPSTYRDKLLFSHCVDNVNLCVWSTPVKITYSTTSS